MRRPTIDVAEEVEVLRSARLVPGWQLGLLTLALAGLSAVATASLSVTAGWLAARLAVGAVIVLAVALTVGSTSLVGLAMAPALASATVGLDRPEGHAWGQTLLLGLVWYVTAELAWGSIEAREPTVRSMAVSRLRVREVAAVVAVTVAVGLAGTALASVAPTRTVLVRGLAVVAVLACIVGLGRALGRLAAPEPTTEDAPPPTDREER